MSYIETTWNNREPNDYLLAAAHFWYSVAVVNVNGQPSHVGTHSSTERRALAGILVVWSEWWKAKRAAVHSCTVEETAIQRELLHTFISWAFTYTATPKSVSQYCSSYFFPIQIAILEYFADAINLQFGDRWHRTHKNVDDLGWFMMFMALSESHLTPLQTPPQSFVFVFAWAWNTSQLLAKVYFYVDQSLTRQL